MKEEIERSRSELYLFYYYLLYYALIYLIITSLLQVHTFQNSDVTARHKLFP